MKKKNSKGTSTTSESIPNNPSPPPVEIKTGERSEQLNGDKSKIRTA